MRVVEATVSPLHFGRSGRYAEVIASRLAAQNKLHIVGDKNTSRGKSYRSDRGLQAQPHSPVPLEQYGSIAGSAS